MKRISSFLFPLLVSVASIAFPGCIESSQEAVDYEAVAVVTGNGTSVTGGWTITLRRADVALGPFYFCAAASGSSTLCESSVAEVTRVTVVDAIRGAATPTPIGTVHGFTGPIQSAAYDFGITWFDTQIEATPAPSLPGGHSVHLEGTARKNAAVIAFVADVDVTPQFQGQRAIATAPASAIITSGATRLEVVFDPARWFGQLDFDAIDAAGQSPLTIAPGTPEHGALLVGIKNLSPLELRFTPR